MINSVGMSSSMSMMASSATQRQPPPDKDIFKVADSDSNGLVSSTELATLAAGIEEITGNSIDVDEALTTFDADGDGSLSGEELFGLMSSQGFNPAGMSDIEGEDGGMRPPPPPPEQAASAYASNSGEDTIATGVQGATGTSSDMEEVFDLLDVNEDGIVSNEELQGLMASQGFNPTGMANSEDDESSMRPPPPPSEVASAYELNSGEDTISQLIELLTGSSDSEEYSSLSMTA